MTRFRLPQAVAPLALAVALAGGLAAAAQTPAPTPDHAWRGHGGPDGAGAGKDWRAAMERHRAQTIADWTLVLKLSPAQAQALTTVMQQPHHSDGRMDRREAGAAPEGTLQRLDAMQARMAEREAHMRDHLAAMRSFYTSLSPEQQRTFDAVGRLGHGGRRHGMRGHAMWAGRAPGGPGGPGGFGRHGAGGAAPGE